MSIKAIIFDVGGVLHSSENEHIFEDIKQTLKLSDEQFENNYHSLISLVAIGQISEAEFWKRFLKQTGSSEKLPEESLFGREYKKRYKIHQDVLDLVKILKQKGCRLALLSDTIPTHYEINVQHGIFDDFPVRVFSHQVGYKKPQPEIYKLTLKKLGIEPSEAVFIDDLMENIEAAEQIGIKGIQFKDADQLLVDLKQLQVL